MIGDPVALLLPPEASQAQHEQYRNDLGLNDSIFVQYLSFLKKAITGDFGKSFRYNVPVFDLILEKFPATLELAGIAIILAVLFGFISGIISAVKPNSWKDKIVRVLSLFGMATPTFWVGIMLILVFSVHFRLLPLSGREGASSFILPGITLGWYSTAVIARMMRSTMIDVLDADYIKMAAMKGAPKRIIFLKHCMRNVLTTMTTVISMQFVILLAGAVITETIFSWPGIGRLLIQAVSANDYPVIQGITLLCSILFVLINFVVDILYLIIDPRIRYS
jgi:peptide/nickel transport system permease protein